MFSAYEIIKNLWNNQGKWIIAKWNKTNVPLQVKLLDIPLQIIERYKHVSWFRKKVNEFREAVGIPKPRQNRRINYKSKKQP